jgi:hypothetical protein
MIQFPNTLFNNNQLPIFELFFKKLCTLIIQDNPPLKNSKLQTYSPSSAGQEMREEVVGQVVGRSTSSRRTTVLLCLTTVIPSPRRDPPARAPTTHHSRAVPSGGLVRCHRHKDHA